MPSWWGSVHCALVLLVYIQKECAYVHIKIKIKDGSNFPNLFVEFESFCLWWPVAVDSKMQWHRLFDTISQTFWEDFFFDFLAWMGKINDRGLVKPRICITIFFNILLFLYGIIKINICASDSLYNFAGPLLYYQQLTAITNCMLFAYLPHSIAD